MKRVILAVFVALVTTGAFAQQQPAKRFCIAPQLEVGYVHNTGFLLELENSNVDLKNGFGVFVGVESRYKFNKWFSVGVALQYGHTRTFNQSASFDYTYTPEDNPNPVTEHYDGKVHYEQYNLNVPVTANFEVTRHLTLYTGAQFTYALSADLYLSDNEEAESYDLNMRNDDMNRCAFYIPIGIRYTFNKPWELGLQYNCQVTRWNKEHESGYKDTRTFPLMLTVAYRFDL